MLARFAGAPRHRLMFRSPLVLAAVKSTGTLPRAVDSTGASSRAACAQQLGACRFRGLRLLLRRAGPSNKVLQLSIADGRAARSLWRLQLNTGTLGGPCR